LTIRGEIVVGCSQLIFRIQVIARTQAQANARDRTSSRHMQNNHEHASPDQIPPEACKPWSFHQNHPNLAQFGILPTQNIPACSFSFSSHLFNSTIFVRKQSKPEPNRLFVMGSVGSPIGSKLLAKTESNQNAATQSTMTHVFSTYYHRGVSVVLLPRRRSEQICDFEGCYLQDAQKR
jgi:hypothetical protein